MTYEEQLKKDYKELRESSYFQQLLHPLLPHYRRRELISEYYRRLSELEQRIIEVERIKKIECAIIKNGEIELIFEEL